MVVGPRRAHRRCHNIAECQRQAGKIAEALALYERAVSYGMMARSHLADCEGDVSVRQRSRRSRSILSWL